MVDAKAAAEGGGEDTGATAATTSISLKSTWLDKL
eukprot:COSAG01_NODE_57278_length_313_cov_0.822430_1_plen_34_part_10